MRGGLDEVRKRPGTDEGVEGGVSRLEHPSQLLEPLRVALVCDCPAAPDELDEGEHRRRTLGQKQRFRLTCQGLRGVEVSPLCGDRRLRKLRSDCPARLAGLPRKKDGFSGCSHPEGFLRRS